MVRTRYTGTGRAREGGLAATHRQDFEAHHTGGDWRHGALDIDMDPPITEGDGIYQGDTVQETLEAMANVFLTGGQGFIAIGDGYGNCSQDIAPAFEGAFTNARLVNGGVILVKAGTYCLQNTVTVPTGITILGEPGASVIIGETAEAPLFEFQTTTTINDVGDGGFTMTESQDKNRIVDMVFYDDLNDNSAGGPSSLQTVPFVRCERGSDLTIDNCQFIGKVETGPNAVTHRVVGYTGAASLNGTTLQFLNSFADGVKSLVEFDATLGAPDRLVIENNRFRTFGDGINADSESTYAVSFTNCNCTIANNHHVGVNSTYQAHGFAFIKDFAVADSSTYISITGTTGGVDSTLSDTNTLIFDDRTVKNEIQTVALNSWGPPTLTTSHPFSLALAGDIRANGDAEVSGGDTTIARGVVHHAFAHRYMNDSTAVDKQYTLDPRYEAHAVGTAGAGFGLLHIVVSAAAATPVTLTIDTTAGALPLGGIFEIVVSNINGADITMSWDSEFGFQSAGDDQFGTSNLIAETVVRWTGTVISPVSSMPRILMDRKDYLP